MKKCYRCGYNQNLEYFNKDLSKKDKKSIYCKLCSKLKNNIYKKSTKFKQQRKKTRIRYKEKERDYLLKYRYGISLKEFESLFNSQNRTCAICSSSKTDSKNFVVDHNHKTGKVRGILCSACNRALGIFKDNIITIEKAISYLKGEF